MVAMLVLLIALEVVVEVAVGMVVELEVEMQNMVVDSEQTVAEVHPILMELKMDKPHQASKKEMV